MNKFCEKCGKPINEGALFCGLCGSEIKQEIGYNAEKPVVSSEKEVKIKPFVKEKSQKIILILSVIMTSLGTAIICISSALRNSIKRYNTVLEVQNKFDEIRKNINPYYDPETYRSQQRFKENLPYEITKYIGIGLLVLGIILLVIFIVNVILKRIKQSKACEIENRYSTQANSSSKVITQIVGVVVGILIALAGLYFLFDGFH